MLAPSFPVVAGRVWTVPLGVRGTASLAPCPPPGRRLLWSPWLGGCLWLSHWLSNGAALYGDWLVGSGACPVTDAIALGNVWDCRWWAGERPLSPAGCRLLLSAEARVRRRVVGVGGGRVSAGQSVPVASHARAAGSGGALRFYSDFRGSTKWGGGPIIMETGPQTRTAPAVPGVQGAGPRSGRCPIFVRDVLSPWYRRPLLCRCRQGRKHCILTEPGLP